MAAMTPLPPPLPPLPASTPSSTQVTLLIRHLPEGLLAGTFKLLFSHYSASDFRLCNSGRLKFLEKILSVKRATPTSSKGGLSEDSLMKTTADEGTKAAPPPLPSVPQSSEAFQTARVASRWEPIAPSLGVDYPFPPQFEYTYPLPDGNILTNIVNTLIAVPRFYTQVFERTEVLDLSIRWKSDKDLMRSLE